MQDDLFLSESHVGGTSAIGDAALRWVEGYQFSFIYRGEIREFMVKTITPAGTTIKLDVGLLSEEPTGRSARLAWPQSGGWDIFGWKVIWTKPLCSCSGCSHRTVISV